MKFKTKCCGRLLVKGSGGIGEVVYLDRKISFLGDVDPVKGKLIDGREVKGKVLIVKGVGGSTVGAYVIYALKYYGNAPVAIVVMESADPIVVSGCVMANITLIDNFPCTIEDGIKVRVREGCLETIN